MASPYGSTYDFAVDATSANKYTWNSGTRVIEMLDDIILMSVTVTDVFAMLVESAPVFSASPEWMQVSLAAVDSANAQAEGADYTFTNENVPTRIQNVTQIFRKTAQVTGTAQAERHFNITDLKAQQVDIRQKELMRDMEYAVINSQISNTNESAARTGRGILQWISDASNTTAVGAALTETNFKADILKKVYDDNFQVTDVFLTDEQYEVINGFAGGTITDATANSIKRNNRNYDASDPTRYDLVEEIITNYGRIRFHQVRDIYLADGTIFGIDREFFHWRFLNGRSPFMEEPPKDGDRWRAVIQCEGLLIADASGNAGASQTGLT